MYNAKDTIDCSIFTIDFHFYPSIHRMYSTLCIFLYFNLFVANVNQSMNRANRVEMLVNCFVFLSFFPIKRKPYDTLDLFFELVKKKCIP